MKSTKKKFYLHFFKKKKPKSKNITKNVFAPFARDFLDYFIFHPPTVLLFFKVSFFRKFFYYIQLFFPAAGEGQIGKIHFLAV